MVKKILAANWKLNKNPTQTKAFFQELKKQTFHSGITTIFFPSATCFESAQTELLGTQFFWGAQNCYTQNQGAFTGEISAQVVKEMGGGYILIGHSERRQYFLESDEFIAQKLKTIQDLNLVPMLCVGESLEQREAGLTVEHLNKQIQVGLSLADKGKKLILAYEPIWAIGTGRVATVAQVQETHSEICNILNKIGFPDVPILYGGSVKADNAKELASVKHVSGFLVGGASLEVSSFTGISQGLSSLLSQ